MTRELQIVCISTRRTKVLLLSVLPVELAYTTRLSIRLTPTTRVSPERRKEDGNSPSVINEAVKSSTAGTICMHIEARHRTAVGRASGGMRRQKF